MNFSLLLFSISEVIIYISVLSLYNFHLCKIGHSKKKKKKKKKVVVATWLLHAYI